DRVSGMSNENTPSPLMRDPGTNDTTNREVNQRNTRCGILPGTPMTQQTEKSTRETHVVVYYLVRLDVVAFGHLTVLFRPHGLIRPESTSG
nr:ORF [Tobacco ringspot virus satellite RNA]